MSRNPSARDLAKDDKLVELLVLAESQGWEIKPTNNGKLMWYPKDKTQNPVTSPVRLVGRTLPNVRTALERAGLDTTSLKDSKAKKTTLEVQLATTDRKADGPIDEEEQVHVDFQRTLAEVLSSAVINVENVPENRANQINTGIDIYMTSVGRALMQFMEDTRTAYQCNHDVDAALKAKLDEAEKLYLESCEELAVLQRHSDKTDRDLSRVGSELQTALIEKNDALERALKAENRMRALRAALTED